MNEVVQKHIRLLEKDKISIQKIKDYSGVESDSAAIRFAVRKVAGGIK